MGARRRRTSAAACSWGGEVWSSTPSAPAIFNQAPRGTPASGAIQIINCGVSSNTAGGIDIAGSACAITIDWCQVNGNNHYGILLYHPGAATIEN